MLFSHIIESNKGQKCGYEIVHGNKKWMTFPNAEMCVTLFAEPVLDSGDGSSLLCGF